MVNVLVSYFPVSASGEKHFGGIVVDVTELRRALEERAAVEREYQRLIEKLPLVMYVNTLQAAWAGAAYELHRPQVEHLFGYPPSAWFADDALWERLVHPDDFALVRDAEISADGGQIECEYRYVRPDGSVRRVSTRCTRNLTRPAHRCSNRASCTT